jgi:hypothetical protein
MVEIMNFKKIIEKEHNKLGGGKPYIQTSKSEALYAIKWIDKIKPNILLEVGTAFGGMSRIIKSCLPNIKLYSLDMVVDNAKSPVWPKKKEDIGMKAPDSVIKLYGDAHDLDKFLLEVKPDMVYHDDGHSNEIIELNLKQCYESNIKYVILHDSHKRRLRKIIENNPYYKEISYFKDEVGISLLEMK